MTIRHLIPHLICTAFASFVVAFIAMVKRGPSDEEIPQSARRLDDHDAEILWKKTTELL